MAQSENVSFGIKSRANILPSPQKLWTSWFLMKNDTFHLQSNCDSSLNIGEKRKLKRIQIFIKLYSWIIISLNVVLIHYLIMYRERNLVVIRLPSCTYVQIFYSLGSLWNRSSPAIGRSLAEPGELVASTVPMCSVRAPAHCNL